MIATKMLGSMMFRFATGKQFALIGGITAIDSLKAAPMFFTCLEEWTEARILMCETARSAETWWVKQGFQYAFEVRTGGLCTHADVPTKLSGDVRGPWPDAHRIAKFVHAKPNTAAITSVCCIAGCASSGRQKKSIWRTSSHLAGRSYKKQRTKASKGKLLDLMEFRVSFCPTLRGMKREVPRY